MKKYKIKSWSNTIDPVEIESETSQFVVINGRRESKSTSTYQYFDTYEQARYEIIEQKRRSVLEATARLRDAEEQYLEAKLIPKLEKNETTGRG